MKKALVILSAVLFAVSLFVGCKNEPGVKNYTVTFDSTGGTVTPEPQTHLIGEKVTKPEDPVKGGCTFMYWVTKDSKEFNFDTDTVTGDMTLYAMWKYKSYTLGSTGPAGGKIFYEAEDVQTSTYLDANGNIVTYEWKYLEVAAEDLEVTEGGTETSLFAFGNNGIVVSKNSTGLEGENAAIGQGRYNTRALVNTFGEKASGDIIYAAKVCEDYETKVEGITYDDWFLPSLGELNEIYKQKSNIGGTFDNYYLSSSESDEYSSWIEHFNNTYTGDNTLANAAGTQSETSRGNAGRGSVRAIRAF